MSTTSASAEPSGWRKSTHSNDNVDCIEVAPVTGDVAVRDSKDPKGAVLTFSAGAFGKFVAATKKGLVDYRG